MVRFKESTMDLTTTLKSLAINNFLNNLTLTIPVKEPQNLEMERSGNNLKNVAWSWQDHTNSSKKLAAKILNCM